MICEAVPSGRPGRPQAYGDTAIQTCLTMKVLFGMALRQTTGFVESLLHLIGLNWTAPNFSTLSRRQKTLALNIPYRGSNGPLHLLIPSRDISAKCPAGQRTAPGSRARTKARGTHASMVVPNGGSGARSTSIARQTNGTFAERGIDEQTLEVRAVEITSNHIGDGPMRPELLDQIPRDQDIGSVTADGACDTRKCRARRSCRDSAAQERQAVETRQRRGYRPERGR
ncbi:DDE family transposase [Salipiger aestuarii]|uniref:DDE family transposase n=1 Tax=Salipiger aestuarii TaxID=568098 RepID=A0A327XF35_9RHOB|nr:DDE family transposase [Salipiger aestuarii]